MVSLTVLGGHDLEPLTVLGVHNLEPLTVLGLWGETIFQPREFPRSGSKAKDLKEEREKGRKLVITMASYALQTPPWVAHAKPPGPKRMHVHNDDLNITSNERYRQEN